jgi:Fuc2NAc and GlcNAc transferase
MLGTLLVALASGAAAALLTARVRREAARFGLLDVPNPRSSHTGAVPRGGGLAIVAVALCAALVLTLTGRFSVPEAFAWLAGGTGVALVGLWDDRAGVSVRGRLLVQFAAALSVVWATQSLAAPDSAAATSPHALLWIAGTLAVVWGANLFNFMDGIDGLAAQQAVFVAGAGWLLGAGPRAGAQGWMLLCLASAAAGFLGFNWAPARIFLGDVGSAFLGFALALLALVTGANNSLALWCWLILQGAFVVDATVTLSVRVLRGERASAAHRQHAYQRLARRFNSHARVSWGFAAVNILWLLPWAECARRHPQMAPWIALAALAPLVLIALLCGAGRPGEIGAPARAAGE